MSAKGKPRRPHLRGWLQSIGADAHGLSLEEARYVEIKFALAGAVREFRVAKGMTQAALAKLVRSSQSRVAKMEAAVGLVAVDPMIRSLLAMGATAKDIGTVVRDPRPRQIWLLRRELRRRGLRG